jgi:hypothetical protein
MVQTPQLNRNPPLGIASSLRRVKSKHKNRTVVRLCKAGTSLLTRRSLEINVIKLRAESPVNKVSLPVIKVSLPLQIIFLLN